MAAKPPRRVYTLAEAARRIGCSDQTIQRAEVDGRLPPARRDEVGHRFYSEDDIERMRLVLRP